jgi:hypothetical protein
LFLPINFKVLYSINQKHLKTFTMILKPFKITVQKSIYISTAFAAMFLLLSFQSCSQSATSGSESAVKLEPIFDGETLDGWKVVAGTAPFEVIDGEIVGTQVKNTPNTFLITEKEYGDFIFEFDVKIEGVNSNSGIMARGQFDPAGRDGAGLVFGRQVEIDASERKWTGGIYDEARRMWLYPLELNTPAKDVFKVGEYNHFRIESIGNELKTWINDAPIAYVIDTLDARGFIGLQVHSISSDDQVGHKVYFKNLALQTENLTPKAFPEGVYVVNLTTNSLSDHEKNDGYKLLFDGKTNAGWVGAKKDAFPEKGWEISNGVFSVLPSDGAESANGGDIVTQDQYSAFDLSFEFKLTTGANSGVKYFVTLEEENTGSAIGLEYQILDDEVHPDAKLGKDGNRTVASLYDLITSNKQPRFMRPVGEWNRGRIISYPDKRVEHYLNGVLVLSYVRGSEEYRSLVAGSKYKDWTNFGEAEKGHILLQDHGDKVSFKNIKIKSL